MKVFVDEENIALPEGAKLKDALKAAGITPPKNATIGLVKGRSEMAKETNSYWLETTKGKLRIDLLETEIQKVWHRSVDEIVGLKARWTDSGAVAFGSFFATLAPTREEHEYDRWEVVLGSSGFEAEKAQIVFVKKMHAAAYGSPAENRGVFATVVGGKDTLNKLDRGDEILGLKPIVEWEDISEKEFTQDWDVPLVDGTDIYTKLEVELLEEAPYGAEFFLAATRDGVLKIDANTSSYISSHVLRGERIEFEHREPRAEGVITIRTQGRGLGHIFIYKADRTSLPSHSIVGKITKGMDLVKLAKPGQNISVKVVPERIMLMGLSLQDAREVAFRRGIDLEIEGHDNEDAVVVDQNPATTMQIIKNGRVKATTIPADRLVAIELYDDALAPKSLDYFRHVVGLKEKPIGPLQAYFVYENTVLFKPFISATSYKEIMPENKPADMVKAGEIGVTNQAARNAGLVGVKSIDDEKYGPSGEKFLATNIIGRVLDLDKLKDIEEDETVYVLEVRR